MARETWAVYSVRDHLKPFPFVADVLFYDRVRVPTPSPDDRARWLSEGWEPDRQAKFVEALGDRACPLEWDEKQREEWSTRWQAASQSAVSTNRDAFAMTRMQLIDHLPRSVTGVDTVAVYRDLSALRADAQLEELMQPDTGISGGGSALVGAAIACQYAIPGRPEELHPDLDQELEALHAAIDVSGTREYRRNRRAYWRWVREFSEGVVVDDDALEDALEELSFLIDEQQSLVRNSTAEFAIRMCFLLTTVTLGLVASPLAPLALAGAGLSVGHFTWDELRARRKPGVPSDEERVGTLFCQIDDEIASRYFSRDHG